MGTFPIFDDARPMRRMAPTARPATARKPVLNRIPAEAWICTAILAVHLSGLLAPTWH